MLPDKKCQISLEATFIVGIVLILFIIVIAETSVKKTELRDSREYAMLENECANVRDTIAEVFIGQSQAAISLSGEVRLWNTTVMVSDEDKDVLCAGFDVL